MRISRLSSQGPQHCPAPSGAAGSCGPTRERCSGGRGSRKAPGVAACARKITGRDVPSAAAGEGCFGRRTDQTWSPTGAPLGWHRVTHRTLPPCRCLLPPQHPLPLLCPGEGTVAFPSPVGPPQRETPATRAPQPRHPGVPHMGTGKRKSQNPEMRETATTAIPSHFPWNAAGEEAPSLHFARLWGLNVPP